jgi:hypothetical protein
MTMGNTVIDGVSNVARSINNTYNLRSNGNSPTNFNTGTIANANASHTNNKLVRYKNTSNSRTATVPSSSNQHQQQLMSLG